MNTVPVSPELLRTMALPQPEEGSKEQRGSILVVAGCAEVPGAALLAATATLRAGAGRLKIATVGSIAVQLGLAIPEAMVIGLAETAQGGLDASAATRLGAAAQACDCVLIGPGMTPEVSTTRLTAALLAGVSGSTSVVLDAASLYDLQAHHDALHSCGERVVITPHAGEMARLLDKSRDEVEADPLGAAQGAAKLLGVVVVMKGARTHIVDPGGTAWLYEGGGVGLATSGSGDTLAGIIAGLLARGAAPSQAAVWGVYLHGEAGRRLADRCGPLGFLARELPGEVPRILADLQAPEG